MVNENNLKKLKQIFRAVLELPDAAEVESLSKTTMRRWDSLAQVALIAAIESEFGITIKVADYERMGSFKSVVLLVDEYNS